VNRVNFDFTLTYNRTFRVMKDPLLSKTTFLWDVTIISAKLNTVQNILSCCLGQNKKKNALDKGERQ